MRGLRSLLRLDDKVAAEGRRIQKLGGPQLRWLAPVTLIAATALHGAILLLPAVKTEALPQPASAAPSFPLVWRPLAPAPRAPEPPPPIEPPPQIASTQKSGAEAVSGKDRVVPPSTRPVRAFTVEPVAEPTPMMALTRISAEVEAIIPNPDPPTPGFEPGPPSAAAAAAAAASDAASAPIEQVQPAYPVAARTLGAEGSVTLRASVLPDGTVAGAVVTSCTRPGLGFEAAALAAVKRWRFAPAPLQAGSREVPVTVQFQRQRPHP